MSLRSFDSQCLCSVLNQNSEAQYKYQFTRWGLRKNVPSSKKDRMIEKCQIRAQSGKGSVITYKNQNVNTRKLVRQVKKITKKDIVFQRPTVGSQAAGFQIHGLSVFSDRMCVEHNILSFRLRIVNVSAVFYSGTGRLACSLVTRVDHPDPQTTRRHLRSRPLPHYLKYQCTRHQRQRILLSVPLRYYLSLWGARLQLRGPTTLCKGDIMSYCSR